MSNEFHSYKQFLRWAFKKYFVNNLISRESEVNLKLKNQMFREESENHYSISSLKV
jgi:hypothetical protein